jgi:hypothetical protein
VKVSIVIDGEHFDIMPTKVEHLIEFLKIVQNQYVLQDRFIRSMTFNGQEPQELTTPFLQKIWQASQEMIIHIRTDDMIENVTQSMDRLHQTVTKLRYDISLCAEYYQLSALDKADNYWPYIMESLEWVLNEIQSIEKHLSSSVGSHQTLCDIRNKLGGFILDLTGLYGQQDVIELGKALENKLCPQLVRLQRLLEDLSQITKLSA